MLNVPPVILIAPPFCEAELFSKLVLETVVVPPDIFSAPPFEELKPLKLKTSLIVTVSPAPITIPPILVPFAVMLCLLPAIVKEPFVISPRVWLTISSFTSLYIRSLFNSTLTTLPLAVMVLLSETALFRLYLPAFKTPVFLFHETRVLPSSLLPSASTRIVSSFTFISPHVPDIVSIAPPTNLSSALLIMLTFDIFTEIPSLAEKWLDVEK